ncbi:hypothetical protein HHK36_031714 [Tetracentron sinense]|uniref:non-specific serine/threonine protein kinase n=1 Tax=Tetracentron sinense TaxID=13715 RepID=A0A835CYA1_TETSI|nr:hypothetical protein HHK36_031714 [Tetracentron sinense]
MFELGFFSPGNSKNRYVGIWYYKKIPIPTVVWVANRDNPLTNSSGILRISDAGNLILLNKSAGSVIWSSNQSKADNPVAQLLDSGNLVIREAKDHQNYLWQSFDHPTDTLLPGMKLGWNFKTGMNRSMTSWKSEDDPSTGDYSFRIDPYGSQEIYLFEGLVPIYRTGPWNGLRNTWLENSRVWSLNGLAPRDECDNYRKCGAYGICDINAPPPVCKCVKGFEPKNPHDWYFRNSAGGCINKSEFDCHKGYGFLTMKGMKLPDNSRPIADKSMTLKECEAVCRKNCSCTAYANSDITGVGTGCMIWTGDLMDLREFTQDVQDLDLYVRVAASELGTSKKSLDLQLFDVAIPGTRNYMDENKKDDLELTLFDIRTIAAATNHFSYANMVGRGGFGCVYKNIHMFMHSSHHLNYYYWLVGCSGYMSPEYAMDGLFSVKSDVFSFGVLVLEIISGMKNRGFYCPDNQVNLLGHVWRLWIEGKADELLDSAMGDSCHKYEGLRFIQVGLLCVQERAEDRPTMSSVILMLSSENAILPQPKKPGFCLGTIPVETRSSPSQREPSTINEVTVTMLEPR